MVKAYCCGGLVWGKVVKTLLLASTALAAFSGSALAADLSARIPVKAPPVIAAVPYSWTSCYIGGHVGAGWDRTIFTDPGNTIPGFFTPFVSQTIAPLGSSIGVNGG